MNSQLIKTITLRDQAYPKHPKSLIPHDTALSQHRHNNTSLGAKLEQIRTRSDQITCPLLDRPSQPFWVTSGGQRRKPIRWRQRKKTHKHTKIVLRFKTGDNRHTQPTSAKVDRRLYYIIICRTCAPERCPTIVQEVSCCCAVSRNETIIANWDEDARGYDI